MIYRKRTQKDVTDAKILEIWNEVMEEARNLYPYYFVTCEPELYQDDSYSHLGICYQSYINAGEKNVDKIRCSRCIIAISTNLKQDYDQIRKTICHEMGHFVAPREHHSDLWKIRADKIGKRWNLVATRLTNNETFNNSAKEARTKRADSYKYRLYCPTCGAEWKYKTYCQTVKKADRYHCGKCKTTLKSEKI